MKRYLVLGLAVVMATALAVPALGGPSNVASKAALSLKKVNKSAKKAQTTADSALTAANSAQSTANSASTAAGNVSADDLAFEFQSDQTTDNSTNSKALAAFGCTGGLQAISRSGGIMDLDADTDPVAYDGISPSGIYGITVARGREFVATGATWRLVVSVGCIRASG